MGAFLIPDYNCVFIHIPKAAGSTVRNGVFEGKNSRPQFRTIPEEWEGLYAFSFVRNPYDRAVSAWKMFTNGMQKSKWGFQRKKKLPNYTFLEFLKIATDESIDHDDRSVLNGKIRHHTIPQVHPYHCIQYADFIGRFENFSDDFAIVAEKIGMKDYSLPHWNKTERASYTTYYDKTTFDIVTNYYKEDLETYGYSFDGEIPA